MIEEKLTKVKDMSDPMILRSITCNFAMPPQQEERAREYYLRPFGLEEVPEPEALALRWVLVSVGDESPCSPRRPGGFCSSKKAHPAFIVSDLDALKERLESAGYEVIVDTSVPGVKRFHTQIPLETGWIFQAGQSRKTDGDSRVRKSFEAVKRWQRIGALTPVGMGGPCA